VVLVFGLLVGVSRGEVEEFVRRSVCVSEFLSRYEGTTFWHYASELCRFFKWLRVVKGLRFSPEGFLEEHLRRRGSSRVEDRRWALRLVLEFSRDNPDLREASYSRKYIMFTVLKQFFDYHEAPLTSAKGVFGRKRRRKFKPRQISMEEAKRILGVVGQRERTVLLIMLQSGMSVGDVLNKFNFMLDYVVAAVRSGVQRLRIDFPERKGNGFSYFTFISRDAIHELKKWLAIREKILRDIGRESNAIFITKLGKPVTVPHFLFMFDYYLRRAKLKSGAWTVTPHMFRKLFKTEASVPERGIDRDCVEFMMGHLSGIESVGGIYDRTPELYADVIEREYAKLEPYINVYSGKHAEQELPVESLTPQQVEELKWLLETVRQNKMKILKALLEE